MSEPLPDPAPEPASRPVNTPTQAPRWTWTAVAIGAFCVQLDAFALNLALPVIRRGLPGPQAAAPWVIGGYLLAAGALMPVAGRLGDLYGRRRVLAVGLALFGAAAAGCALAPSLPLLVAARVVQGAGGALIMPAGLALLTCAFPGGHGRRMTGRALGLAGLATACGPFVGGVLAQSVSWRAVFWLTVVPTVAAACCTRRATESRDSAAARTLDTTGAAAVTGLCACLALSVAGAAPWAWAGGAAALGAVFVRAERRSPAPLVDLALFRNRRYVRLTAAGALANTATVALLYVIPLTLQHAYGLSPQSAGLAFLAPAAALAAGGPAAGRVRPAASVPVMALCLAAAAVALWATPQGGPHGAPLAALLLASTAAAAALGVAGALALTGTQAVVRPQRAGEASGVTKAVLTVTAGLGLTLTGTGSHPSLHLPAAACLLAAAALAASSARRPSHPATTA
ncbi:MFS transporter [Streptomyces pinistramenti]|uniref:MFS transporter n=1 Tax=Streptomyces pinistramenti TaxID=2884812 RepID=UPI001D062CF7|nr:MFS transporter [Streptomyces pinistramenti]MCB5907689.1 MFS transporter [Streptomyces pinistramenti]